MTPQLAVLDAGIADAQYGYAVELLRVTVVVDGLQLTKHGLEDVVAKRDIRPVLQVHVTKGHRRQRVDRNVLPVNDVPYGRTVYRDMAPIHVLTADSLTHCVMVFVLSVADYNGVLRSYYT